MILTIAESKLKKDQANTGSPSPQVVRNFFIDWQDISNHNKINTTLILNLAESKLKRDQAASGYPRPQGRQHKLGKLSPIKQNTTLILRLDCLEKKIHIPQIFFN